MIDGGPCGRLVRSAPGVPCLLPLYREPASKVCQGVSICRRQGLAETNTLTHTALYDAHCALGARMVPFAGYAMPVQYTAGVMKEHLHTRAMAGLFDVGHMGQVRLTGPDHETVAAALEAVTPGDFVSLKPGRQKYTLLLNDDGGIIDDLMVARPADATAGGELFIVVNASRKAVDVAVIKAKLPSGVTLDVLDDRALLALQGPAAAKVMARLSPKGEEIAASMTFMDFVRPGVVGPCEMQLSRSGYTGEDGFEISVRNQDVAALWSLLADQDEVMPAGLGARDSLRLEAGLPLYGNDIDETTSPVEAGLTFAVNKARRPGGERAGGFPGAVRVFQDLQGGVSRRRVGIVGEGRAPIRAGVALFSSDACETSVGTVTSGSFGPTKDAPVAMAYVATESAEEGTRLFAEVRGKRLPAVVAKMPFVQPNYFRR